MGNCGSTEEQKRSQEIDKIINQDRKKLREEVKLLLLGNVGECYLSESKKFI